MSEPAGFDALLAPLPAFAQEELRRRNTLGTPPRTAAGMFAQVEGWMVGAGIAEGRGGYPGVRGTPGWVEYVTEQRRSVAVFRAIELSWGPAPPALARSVDRYEQRYPPPKRLMGEGWEPHVNDVAGRLIYSFPVQSGFVTVSFDMPVTTRDVAVLLADPYRRAVMGAVTHTVFQRSIARGQAEVTQLDFRVLADAVLHAPTSELTTFLASFDRQHNIVSDHTSADRGTAGRAIRRAGCDAASRREDRQ